LLTSFCKRSWYEALFLETKPIISRMKPSTMFKREIIKLIEVDVLRNTKFTVRRSTRSKIKFLLIVLQ